jgi:hypothetical protein
MCFLAAVCESCFAERLEEERRSQLDYVRAAIFVRQVGPGSNESLIRNILGSGSTAEASFEQEDPDYQVFKKQSVCRVFAIRDTFSCCCRRHRHRAKQSKPLKNPFSHR